MHCDLRLEYKSAHLWGCNAAGELYQSSSMGAKIKAIAEGTGLEDAGRALELRVTSAEKAAYDEAAELEGMERSDWIRLILKKAARKASRAKSGSADA